METAHGARLPPLGLPKSLLAKGTSAFMVGKILGHSSLLAIAACLCCSSQSGSCVGVLVWIKGSVTGQGHEDILLHKTWEM